ncbi:MAG: hypothetical protein LBJ63_09165 [Prevotellaceae bacterium]|jgi:hypothetical protein|nr:hypothetical protein [Prevotellaceae bacterium]
MKRILILMLAVLSAGIVFGQEKQQQVATITVFTPLIFQMAWSHISAKAIKQVSDAYASSLIAGINF